MKNQHQTAFLSPSSHPRSRLQGRSVSENCPCLLMCLYTVNTHWLLSLPPHVSVHSQHSLTIVLASSCVCTQSTLTDYCPCLLMCMYTVNTHWLLFSPPHVSVHSQHSLTINLASSCSSANLRRKKEWESHSEGIKSGGWTPQPVTKVPRRRKAQKGVPPGKFWILSQQMVASGDQLVMSFYDF